MRSIMRHVPLLPVLLVLATGPALAAGPTPGEPQVLDYDAGRGCRLILASSGKAMLIAGSGLIPGESYRLTVSNGDMVPVRMTGLSDGGGQLLQYYVPFRFNRDGGVVTVRISGANCQLAASAAWTRGVPVIP